MSSFRWFALTLLMTSCAQAPPEPKETPVNTPAESNPLRQGFTQRPDPETPGLPPQIPPLLTVAEANAARERLSGRSAEALSEAQLEIESLVRSYEEEAEEQGFARLRVRATELARSGLVPHLTIEELYAAYLFPNDVDEADRAYKERFVVLTGTVSPHNMRDFADGFKLVERNPYVHEPLLLATDYELSFVECRLARASEQPLRDWQPIHFVAQVAGKKRSDVLLRRCVVL